VTDSAAIAIVMATAVAVAMAVALRALFIRQASASRVDHHYWCLIADSHRRSQRLPALLADKYLLEPVEQAYPPFFGWLMGKLPPQSLTGSLPVWLTQAADAVVCLGMVLLALEFGASPWSVPLIVALVGAAPVMVSYNFQANSRSFGNVFLTLTLVAQLYAAAAPPQYAWLLWLLAIAATAAVWLTHKMTTQLMLVLWLPWAWSLDSGLALVVPPLGLLFAALLVGPGFIAYQVAAHIDIMRFWRRHWPRIGVHAVQASPIYGRGDAAGGGFHRGGWRGVIAHLRLASGYAPVALMLPLAWLLLPLPPAWLQVWAIGSLAWALLTLLLPALKTFGGGHLYVFNAVPPLALWFGLTLDPAQPVSILLPLAGLGLSLAALGLGWRQRAMQKPVVDAGFADLQQRLLQLPPTRIAVLPLVAAEAVASGTHHAVLWGGHGYSFDLVEPLFPVIAQPIGSTLAQHGVYWMAWRHGYWPELEQILTRECRAGTAEQFGEWRLLRLDALPPPPPRRVVVIGAADLGSHEGCEIVQCDACPANPLSLLRWSMALRRVMPDTVYIAAAPGALPSLLGVLLAGRPRAFLRVSHSVPWLAAVVPSLCPMVVAESEAEIVTARAAGISPERILAGPVTLAKLRVAQERNPA
jgi:hypothetical protein